MTAATTDAADAGTTGATGKPVRVMVIVGSIRTNRLCPTPARWLADQAVGLVS